MKESEAKVFKCQIVKIGPKVFYVLSNLGFKIGKKIKQTVLLQTDLSALTTSLHAHDK